MLTRKIDTENFVPGSLGFHEIVDRTCLIAELFSDYVANHPGVDASPKIRRLVKRIEQDLFDLYQELATIHAKETQKTGK
jgi:cob(I)alamin adenosyltransferase